MTFDPSGPLPVIALRDTLVLPGTLVPLILGRAGSVEAVRKSAELHQNHVLMVLQKNPALEQIQPENLYGVGVVGLIHSTHNLPGQMLKITIEAMGVVEINNAKILGEVVVAEHRNFSFVKVPAKVAEALRGEILDKMERYLMTRPDLPDNVFETLSGVSTLDELLMAATPFVEMELNTLQELIEIRDPLRFAKVLIEILDSSFNAFKTQQRVEQEVRVKLQNNQKEYMIREQIRLLQEELDHGEALTPEAKEWKDKFESIELPTEIRGLIGEEINRLSMMAPASPEYGVHRNYLEWVSKLPWGNYAKDKLEIAGVKRLLNSHHYGLEKVKERMLEHLAVLKRTGVEKAPILCLVGPPGVGKTTLAKSVAEAMNRPFVRISLGGVRDEAEIRGHRKTYIGAMPGRLVDALKKAKVMNPVILLDEMDKLARDHRGDPASALLEVLDPEQNSQFNDHYLGFGFDLSQVLFIATANVEYDIPDVLLDRMEVIRLPGYYRKEKLSIINKHLLPALLTDNGLTEKEIELPQEVLEKLLGQYTREAGVRNLRKTLDRLLRKRVLELETHKKYKVKVEDKDLEKYLGAPPFERPRLPRRVRPGVVTGLAWTSVGGDVLAVETSLLKGKGHLKLTGKLGDVMKESAHIALTLVRERAKKLGIDPAIFAETDIHIHFPEGATPKDGPSAGIALVMALVSAFTKVKIPSHFAFTGEVSLSGQILAIGGLPEKSLAALEAGVVRIFIPEDNAAKAKELPTEVRRGMKIHQLKHVDELISTVMRYARAEQKS